MKMVPLLEELIDHIFGRRRDIYTKINRPLLGTDHLKSRNISSDGEVISLLSTSIYFSFFKKKKDEIKREM